MKSQPALYSFVNGHFDFEREKKLFTICFDSVNYLLMYLMKDLVSQGQKNRVQTTKSQLSNDGFEKIAIAGRKYK